MKLNLGSFTVMFPGWVNIDLVNHPWMYGKASQLGCQFYSMDLRGGIPNNDNSVELIHCSHMFEHLTFPEGEAFMKECYRVLQPGGTARFAVPDLDTMVGLYEENRLAELGAINEPCKTAKHNSERFWNILFEDHKSLYDYEALRDVCLAAGFTNIARHKFGEGHPTIIAETKDLFPEVSLYVEVTK